MISYEKGKLIFDGLPHFMVRLMAGRDAYDAAFANAKVRADAHGKASFTLPVRPFGSIEVVVDRGDIA